MNAAPSIDLKYSWIYKKKILGLLGGKTIAELDPETFTKKVAELKENKKLIENNLREVTKILNVKWVRKEIRVYLLPFRARGTTFSDPITIPVCASNGLPNPLERCVYLITHELIHNALEEIENISLIITTIKNDYLGMDSETATHILVFSTQHILYKKLGNEKFCEQEIAKRKDDKSLQTAWNTVLKEGAEIIIKRYLFDHTK